MTIFDKNLHNDGIPVFASIERGPLEFWKSACDLAFDLTPIDRDVAADDYEVSGWFVEPVTFARTSYHQMINRHASRHIEEAGQQLFIHRFAQGGATIQTRTAAHDCVKGSITAVDYARPFEAIHATSVCEGVFVPHAAVRFDPKEHASTYFHPPSSILGRLINRELDYFFNLLETGASTILPADLQRLLGCVELALGPNRASKSAWARAQASMRAMIIDFIETHLSSPDLSVTLILNTFAISRAGLYRLFETDAGVRNYITRRRLQRAVMQIARHPKRRGEIRAAAERFGFSSDVTFNRAVHRAYGTSPGSLFEMPIAPLEHPRPRSAVQNLMAQAARKPQEVQG
ncbi:MAG: AraC family transcriptional regulator [Pseudomonadota bacterium]